jgi:hypothetical protein
VVGLRQEKQPLKLMISDLFPEKITKKTDARSPSTAKPKGKGKDKGKGKGKK